jgi:hypothetical protein
MPNDEHDRQRDALLTNLLKTPPQPRAKRDREKPKPESTGVESRNVQAERAG